MLAYTKKSKQAYSLLDLNILISYSLLDNLDQ